MDERISLRHLSTPCLAVVTLTATCVMSAFYLPLWFDELLSYYLLSDPSLGHMLSAQHDLINTTPPLYFIITWPLAQIFGASELTLRLVSSIGISTALCLMWGLLRRLYGTWPASVAVLICFFSSHTIRFQNMEARFYGLFLVEISAAVVLAVLIATQKPIRWRYLAGVAAIHAMLVTTHYFGFLYSGAILLAMLWSLRKELSRLVQCAAAVFVGWLAFIPCLPMFFHHLEFNKPHGWIHPPKVSDLVDLFRTEVKSSLLGGLALLALGTLLWRFYRPVAQSQQPLERTEIVAQRRVMAWCMLMLFLVPIGVWVISRVMAPIFVARYFLSDVLVWSFLYANAVYFIVQASSRVAQQCTNSRHRNGWYWGPRLMLGLIGALYLILPTAKSLAQMRAGTMYKRPPIPTALLGELLQYHVPVVMEDTLEFMPLNFYSNPGEQYFCILDRQAALDPEADRGANTLDQIGSALKRHYPDLPLITTQELLSQYDRFIVCDVDWLLWYERNIENHSEFKCSELVVESSKTYPFRAVLVEHRAPAALGTVPQTWRRR